jgi:hypothetical protein
MSAFAGSSRPGRSGRHCANAWVRMEEPLQ